MIIKYTIRWKYNIGDIISNEKINITIIDKKIVEKNVVRKGKPYVAKLKYYKYKCNVCGYQDGWKEERKILIRGCPCCSGRIAVDGINSVADIRPDLIKYFKYKKDAHEHTIGSHFSAKLICTICCSEREMSIKDLTQQGFSCKKCSDSISYPEKFIMSFLEQAGIEYYTQLSKKDLSWCKNYRYDFYIPNKNCIIEANGEQHYNNIFSCKDAMTLEQIKKNDIEKEQLALKNGIDNYVKINCEKSDVETIKNGIIESKICDILEIDITKINFKECDICGNKNIMKEACEIYSKYDNITTTKIAKILNVNKVTIIEYLKRGSKLGLCNYNTKAYIERTREIIADKQSKIIEAYDQKGNYIGTFKGARRVKEYFENSFNLKLNTSNIIAVCAGKYKHHKNYIFKYI